MELFARHYRTGEAWLLDLRGGAVERLEAVDHVTAAELVLAPSFFDIQVNGFAGVDFNARDLRPEEVLRATRALACHGVTRFLPTLISGPHDRMRGALSVLVEAAARYPEVGEAVWGVHLEGPHISGEEGSIGTHDPRWVRPPDESEFAELQEAAVGRVRLVTLAPERDGAMAFIRRRVAEDVVVALGHTRATPEQIAAAVQAGARLSTHLGNACEALLPRHRNYVMAQLGEDALAASFIADGHHLPPYVLRSFVRAKGLDRSILTSDGMAAAGAPPGRYWLGDLELEVGEDRVVRQPGKSYLAGSALTLDRAVANAREWCKLPWADAIDLASLSPWRLFSADTTFKPDAGGDFLLARCDEGFAVAAAVRAGMCVAAPGVAGTISTQASRAAPGGRRGRT